MTTFNDLDFQPHRYPVADDDVQAKIFFPNGYGASVIKTGFSYGGGDGRYELAVLYDERITYDTPVTEDVLGWLDEDGVTKALQEIEALPPKEGGEDAA